METQKHTLRSSDLYQFTGTERWYRHALTGGKLLYTDGVKYVAEKGGAYWLIDLIMTSMAYEPRLRTKQKHEFTVWKLKVNPDKTAVITASSGNRGCPYFEKVLEYTDFPMDEIDLWFENGVLILPTEH